MITLPEILHEVRKRREVTADQAIRLIASASVEGDRENRLALLSMAGRQLGDVKVFQAWMSLLAREKDPAIQRTLLEVVASLVTGPARQPEQLDRLRAFIPRLLEFCEDDALAEAALPTLGALAVADQRAGPALAEAYRALKSKRSRDRIIRSLASLRYRWEGISAFLREALPDIDFGVKPGVVGFLLDRDALTEREQIALLSPTEPEEVRVAIIHHWNNLSAPASPGLFQAIAGLVKTDPAPRCRLAAMGFLESRISDHREATEIFLDLLDGDADPQIRRAAVMALSRSATLDARAISRLEAVLATEQERTLFEAVLDLLRPHAGAATPEGDHIRGFIFRLLDRGVTAPVAQLLYRTLEDAVQRDPEISARLMERAESPGDARIKATLLESIARRAPDQPAFAALFAKACGSPAPAIRNAAAEGLLALPLTRDNTAIMLLGLDLLADPAVEDERKVRLGRKIARLPAFPPGDAEKIRRLLDGFEAKEARPHGFDGMKRALAEALDRTRSAAVYDWDLWRTRLHREKQISGIFPAIYLAFDQYPEEATALLKEVLKTDDRETGPVFARDRAILSFLQARGRIDDEISRLAMNFLLTKDERYDDPNFYLALLKSNLTFPELKAGLWLVFERGGPKPALLLEILWLAYGGDTPLAEAFLARVKAKTRQDEVERYLAFLEANSLWPPCRDLVAAISELVAQEPALGELRNKDILKRLRVQFHLDTVRPGRSVKPRHKPGLLDE